MRDELIAFLSARFDDREKKARELLAGAQRVSLTLKDPRYLGKRIPGWYHWPDVEAMAARELREVEANRRKLALAQEMFTSPIEPGNGQDLLQLLALPDDDHDDYQESWQP